MKNLEKIEVSVSSLIVDSPSRSFGSALSAATFFVFFELCIFDLKRIVCDMNIYREQKKQQQALLRKVNQIKKPTQCLKFQRLTKRMAILLSNY